MIGAGVTLYEGLKAAETLAKEGINVRVLDPFTIKPIDAKLIIDNALQCGRRIITVEDHYPEGILSSFHCLTHHKHRDRALFRVGTVKKTANKTRVFGWFFLGCFKQNLKKPGFY